jgi:Holliday junction resolvase-like predicted endonuclease
MGRSHLRIKLMYLIGLINNGWRYITDGNVIYHSEIDVRFSSAPPYIGPDAWFHTLHPNGENRINTVSISQAEFLPHCRKNNIIVRSVATPTEKLRKGSGPAAIAGLAGALFGGPIGAVIAAGLTGYFSSGSDFEPKKVASAFERAKVACLAWNKYDNQKAGIDANEAADYERIAADKWRRFHKLRNLAALDDLDGIEFEAAIAALYQRHGYEIVITRATGDFGVDILATKGSKKLAIQTKRHASSVGVKAVQEVAAGAVYYKATEAVVVTNSFYTEQAKELAEKLDVRLINKKHLATMWQQQGTGSQCPPFDLQTFEKMKKDIVRELGRIDSASGKRKKPNY